MAAFKKKGVGPQLDSEFHPWQQGSDGVAGGCTVAPISDARQLTPRRTKKQGPSEVIFFRW